MNEENQGLPPIETKENVSPPLNPVLDQTIQPQPNNIFNKKRIIIYIVLLVLVLVVVVLFVVNGMRTQSGNSKTSPTPAVLLTPTEAPIPTPEFVKNQLIIKYKTGMRPDEIDPERKAILTDLYKEIGVVLEKKAFESSSSALNNYYILDLNTKLSLDDVINKLKTLSEIENVEKHYINKSN